MDPKPTRTSSPRRTPKKGARARVRPFHRWVGVWAGLWLAFTGTTGALLVLSPSAEEALHPELYRVQVGPSRVGLESIRTTLSQRYPGRKLIRVELSQQPQEVHRFVLDGQLLVLADPYSGRILGEKPLNRTWTGFIKPWHTALLPGAAGEKLTTLVALGALSLLASGLTLSRPTGPALRKGPRRSAFDLHRWLGWGSTLPLGLAALTGGLLIFYAPIEHALVRWSGFEPLAPGPQTQSAHNPDLDGLVASAEQALPQGVPVRIQFPKSEGEPLSVRLRQSGEPNPKGRSFVRVRPDTAQVVDVEDARRVPASVWLLQGTYRIHTGDFGAPARAFVFGLGLTPATLWASGMWMRRRRSAAGSKGKTA